VRPVKASQVVLNQSQRPSWPARQIRAGASLSSCR